jgi:signal transduction histidine kinase/DNA-binding response OmpR family regulator
MEALSASGKDLMWIRVVFAAAMYLSVLNTKAQDFTVRGELHHLIEKKDGFENARCFILDQNGFFWIGTTEGVLRYNGHEVDKLEDLLTHEPPSLRDVTALHLDKTGNIWIGARGKVNRLSVSSMTLDEIRIVSGDSTISRLPEINDIHLVDKDRLLVSTFQGLYILTRRSTEDSTWNVSHFNQLTPTASEFRLLDSLQQDSPLICSLKLKDSLRHSVAFTLKDSSDFLIVSTSPKMFSGIDQINDMAWIENQSGERSWSKYDQFYFLALHPTVVRLPAGKYTLYGQQKLYNYFSDVLPEYKVSVYALNQQSAGLFQSMRQDWLNRRSIVEDYTDEMFADEHGTVWITGGGGLTSLKFVEGKPVFKVYTPHEGKEFGQHGIHTYTIKPSRSNGFWLLGRGYGLLAQLRQGATVFRRNHIMFYEAGRQRFSRLSFEGSDLIADIAEDTDSSLWVVYENGMLNRITLHKGFGGAPQLADEIDLRSFGRAHKLVIDRPGNLWVLTEKQGLIKITRSKNQVSSWSWPRDKVLFGKLENVLDEFLLFTGDGSVFRSRIGGKILNSSIVGKLEHPVIDLVRLSDSSAIAATRHGRIYFLNKHLHSVRGIGIDSIYFTPRNPFASIKLVRLSDDKVYLCTNQGLFTINVPEKKISKNLFDPQPNTVPMISDVFSYRGKHLAVVKMYSGIKGPSSFIVPVEASERKKGFIYDEYADLAMEINTVVKWSDRILVGSELGIHEYNAEKDTFLLFTPPGYPPVYNMVADDRGFIWSIGRDGVTCFDTGSGSFHTVAKLSLPEKKFNELPPAFWQMDAEHVLFIVNNRLYNLLIESAHVQKNKPSIHFDNIGVRNNPGENRKVNPINNKVVLSPGQNTFTVDFAATDLAFPERAYYSYRLIGYHEDWINTSYSEIQFINVPPGDYTLELRIADGLRTSFTSMSIRLEPFWWQTIAARLLFLSVMLLIIWWLSYIYIRDRRLQKNLELEHQEKEKIAMMSQMRSRFFANISHEFRTPLTLISGPIEDRIRAEKDPNEKKALSKVLDQTKRMLKLVNELLDLSKLESNRLPVESRAGDIMQYVHAIAESFNNVAVEKELMYSVTTNRQPVFLEFDPEHMTKLLVNLIANAIKFCPVGGNVSVEFGYDHQTQLFRIEVFNDGEPIPESELSMIFNPFYRAANAQTQGSGIGLALVKELVENMNGTIDAFSDALNGNRFRVLLPLTLAKSSEFKAEDIRPGGSITTHTSSPAKEQPETGSHQLLIIEDDEEMGDYVSSVVTAAGQPVIAANGEAGFKMAVDIIPDLIICDVMMPGSDGIACCERLKRDPRTDHIPIILLTAKTELADRMDGLRAGADDYITKPFSSEELRIKVKNLINQRNQLKVRFSRDIQSSYKDLSMKSSDVRFLDKAISIVHEQIGNSEFDITQFSSSMNLSRTHLHKKLKVITGQSPSEFVRNLRLQRASQLLAAGADQVSVIAYDTGFNNVSYFTRMFKSKYGVSPTEYKRQSFAKA